jgi:polyhydroxybutyrate depolymerase
MRRRGNVAAVARSRVLVLLALAMMAVAGCGSGDGGTRVGGTGTVSTATSPPGSASAAGGPCARGAAAPPTRLRAGGLDTILRVPASARGHRAPLVVALHFASGTGAEMERTSRLTAEARRSGFVVAYPSASRNHFWDVGADYGRLTRALDELQAAACIDPARVYVAGISNGGFMATVLACQMADRVAAAALFAPGISGTGDCAPARPISILEVHGTADRVVPYRSDSPGQDVPAFIAGWARRNGCATTSRSERVTAALTRFSWPGCREGAEVEHLRLTGGRHIELLPDLRAAGVDPAHEAWRFLASKSLPG